MYLYHPRRPQYFPTELAVDINSELDELDREEFYRLKKAGPHLQTAVTGFVRVLTGAQVKNNKQRDSHAADKGSANHEKGLDGSEESVGTTDVLGEGEDQDVIF